MSLSVLFPLIVPLIDPLHGTLLPWAAGDSTTTSSADNLTGTVERAATGTFHLSLLFPPHPVVTGSASWNALKVPVIDSDSPLRSH